MRTIVQGWCLPPRGYVVRWPGRERPAEAVAAPPVANPSPRRAMPDFMGDPLAGTVSSAFDFDDLAAGGDSTATAERARRLGV